MKNIAKKYTPVRTGRDWAQNNTFKARLNFVEMHSQSRFFLLVLIILSLQLSAQETEEKNVDTLSISQGQDLVIGDTLTLSTDSSLRVHSPRRAAIYSAILPGLGQLYNRKWWKVPIVYGGFAFFGISAQQNHVLYKDFKAAYEHKMLNDGTAPVNEYEALTADQLLYGKKTYRRDRDYMIILSSLWYVLNIVDASVDANLFYWEVDDDLSLRLEPDFKFYTYSPLPAAGLSLRFKF